LEGKTARYAANRWVNLAEQGWVNSGERHRLDRITGQLLDLARFDAGEIVFKAEDVAYK